MLNDDVTMQYFADELLKIKQKKNHAIFKYKEPTHLTDKSTCQMRMHPKVKYQEIQNT